MKGFEDFNSNELFTSDNTGGLLDSGVYPALIKYAYFTKSASGNTGLNVILEIKGKEIAPKTSWLMYSDGSKYKVENGKKVPTFAMKQFNDLCYVATGLTVDRMQEPENKAVNIYNWEQQKKVPTMVPCLTELTNKQIMVGIRKVNTHKQVKVGNSYVPTTTIKPTNVVDKYYTIEGKTATEAVSGKEAAYSVKWHADNKGRVFEEQLKVAPIEEPKSGNTAPAESAAKELNFD